MTESAAKKDRKPKAGGLAKRAMSNPFRDARIGEGKGQDGDGAVPV